MQNTTYMRIQPREWLVVCKGICVNHRALRPHGTDISRYAKGQKRCQICCVFVIWSGLHCPCCGTRLRLKPRIMRLKQRLNDNPHEGIAKRYQSQQPSKLVDPYYTKNMPTIGAPSFTDTRIQSRVSILCKDDDVNSCPIPSPLPPANKIMIVPKESAEIQDFLSNGR